MNIYVMPDLKLSGVIGGFIFPWSECSDNSGHVWVADLVAQTLTKFSRTGDVLDVLDDPYGGPYDCAVDPTTGNLAVANEYGNTGLAGNLVVFANATGPGTILSVPQMFTYYYVGYDPSGNLWVDGFDDISNIVLAGCNPSGDCNTIPITNGAIVDPGFIQWAIGQNTWYIADQYCPPGNFCVYPISTSGVLGSPITFTDPEGHTVCTMFQGAITNAASIGGASRVLAGGANDRYCGSIDSADRWSFPAGGASTHHNDDIEFPMGAAISHK